MKTTPYTNTILSPSAVMAHRLHVNHTLVNVIIKQVNDALMEQFKGFSEELHKSPSFSITVRAEALNVPSRQELVKLITQAGWVVQNEELSQSSVAPGDSLKVANWTVTMRMPLFYNNGENDE